MHEGINSKTRCAEQDQECNEASGDSPFVLLCDGDHRGTAGDMGGLDGCQYRSCRLRTDF
jgi:hypothetical protein